MNQSRNEQLTEVLDNLYDITHESDNDSPDARLVLYRLRHLLHALFSYLHAGVVDGDIDLPNAVLAHLWFDNDECSEEI